MELKQGFRAAHRNRSVEAHIVTDVLFTGMGKLCLIQLVFNSSVATHIVTDVLFTCSTYLFLVVQNIHPKHCTKIILYKNTKY